MLDRHSPSVAIPELERRIRSLEGGETLDEKTINQIREITKQNMYAVYITATRGNILRGDVTETMLIAYLYSWGEDVTEKFNSNAFVWTRNSGNETLDSAWNEAHSIGGNEITITKDDIDEQATFFCTVTDEDGNEISEQITVAIVEDGADGRSIVATTRYYILSEVAPTEPTTEWDMVEPTFNPATDIDKTLYFADYTTFSDGTSAWSEISASSSYEAAKQAYFEAISKPAIFSNTGYVKNSATGEELIVYAYEVTSIIDGNEVSTINYYMKKDIADTEGNATTTEYYSIASPTATTYTIITEAPPQGQEIDIEPTGMKIGDVWIKGNGDICAYTADGWQGTPTAAMLESLGSDIGLTDEMMEELQKAVNERLTAAEEDIKKAAQASTVAELQETVNQWNDTAEALDNRLGLTESDLEAMKDNIKVVNATLVIKPTATSKTEMVVAAAKIIPYVNGIPVAEFGIDGFKGANVMTNDIAFAQKANDGTLTPKWRWITRSNGHLTLKAAD